MGFSGAVLLAYLAAMVGPLDVSGLTSLSRVFFGSAAVCFLAAAYFALEVIRPASHTNADATALAELVKSDWNEPEDVAAQRVARLTTAIIPEIRLRNRQKADRIHAALTSEFVALGMLTCAVVASLAGQ